ncbi:MAG TPA: uracil phosphoribosyltransferase [Oscillatoriales cyanobacterium M59_W2019_021]|nr:MAG: uracil phosphoribosyltransferase [Cyanobacteria bacterium J055]HIK31409.1 uracil phosphoribosyltransferase [Oscillatoriales cyanobacterium M4454_W2019_049]HIK50093.1 uracil phosphoribosyltransferase [Oscillatoriales cyanobacterium M59_W2019_021]
MTQQLRIYVPPHPLIKNWLAMARDAATPSVLFRTAMRELGRWLTYEAIREWLPTEEVTIQTPLAATTATMINAEAPIAIVPILRAGLALLDGALEVLPAASIYHLGMVRDEETLEASCYLNKLPEKFDPQTRILITEPMLATGGTIVAVIEELIGRGIDPSFIRIIAIVAAPPALQKLSQAYPGLVIYSAGIDEHVNDLGFIVPGLGDAGDRSFGT